MQLTSLALVSRWYQLESMVEIVPFSERKTGTRWCPFVLIEKKVQPLRAKTKVKTTYYSRSAIGRQDLR